MDANLKTTKSVMQLLGCKKATFYEHRKKHDIQPKKSGNISYYSDDQIETLRKSLGSVQRQTQTDRPPTDTDGQQTDTQEKPHELSEHLKEEIERVRKDAKEEIERLRNKSEQDREKIEGLMREVGRWEGLAKNHEKKIQLLEEKVESQFIDAEIIPEEMPEKKGWWKKFWEG